MTRWSLVLCVDRVLARAVQLMSWDKHQQENQIQNGNCWSPTCAVFCPPDERPVSGGLLAHPTRRPGVITFLYAQLSPRLPARLSCPLLAPTRITHPIAHHP